MDKYDKKIMDIYANGKKVGTLSSPRTAEEYSDDFWNMCKIRRLFHESMDSCKNSFKTLIINDPPEPLIYLVQNEEDRGTTDL